MKQHLVTLLVYASDPPTYDNVGARLYKVNVLHLSSLFTSLDLSLRSQANLNQTSLVSLGQRSEEDWIRRRIFS